jgi:hypothetical protein
MGRSGMKKRAMTVLIAVTLVGCSDNKSAIGRYQVHESSVDEYFGTKSDSMLTSKLSHVFNQDRHNYGRKLVLGFAVHGRKTDDK